MSAPKVIAIVLNWNRAQDTARCVHSLLASDYQPLEILVVDNGSSLSEYENLQKALPEIPILRSLENLGFAGGNNLGLRYALAQSVAYVLVINNDTVVDARMVGQLVAAAEAHPQAGVVGPIIYYLDQPQDVWFAGYRFDHGIYLLRRGLNLRPPLQAVEQVDFVSGCAMLMRREVLERVGLFSEDYFMYYEDLDYCFRVKQAGLRILCVTGARMWHAVSASTGGADSPLKQYYQVKSSLIFYRQHFRGWKYGLNLILRLTHAGYTLLGAIVTRRLKIGSILMFWRGLKEGWRQTPVESK